jgi:hypothetical protein
MAAQKVALEKVKGARSEIQNLRTERSAVAAGKQSELSAGAKATEAAVNKYFKGSDDKVLNKVDNVLKGTESILADNGSKYNFQSSSSNVIANARATGAIAVAHPALGRNIYLTPSFSKVSDSLRADTVVHESAHLKGINVFPPLPEAYGNDVFNLGRFRSLNNADNYSQFVIE